MKIKHSIVLLFIFFIIGNTFAQDRLMQQLDSVTPQEKQVETNAFKGLQICNMQSTKLPAKGELYILISHRFGDLSKGLDNFFGLDNAYTKIGGIYGVTNWMSLGVSRHTFNKIYELSAKYKFANQSNDKFPLTIVGYSTMDINTNLSTDEYHNLKRVNRFAYTTQLPISRKFTDAFSFELTPMYIHKNLYNPETERKDQVVLGTGGRYKLSKRLSLNAEYAVRLNAPKTSSYHNPLSLGLDIETGGHIFQMVVSNSQPMNDAFVFSNANGKWNGGSLYFGFNMYRVF